MIGKINKDTTCIVSVAIASGIVGSQSRSYLLLKNSDSVFLLQRLGAQKNMTTGEVLYEPILNKLSLYDLEDECSSLSDEESLIVDSELSDWYNDPALGKKKINPSEEKDIKKIMQKYYEQYKNEKPNDKDETPSLKS